MIELPEEIRSYQKTGISFLVDRKRSILGDEQGLGKTAQALFANHELSGYPCLILTMRQGLGVWPYEIKRWLPTGAKITIYAGTPAQRAKQWPLAKKSHFVITTYSMITELITNGLRPKMLICDEYHRQGLLNRKTATFDKLKASTPYCQWATYMTGTPYVHGPHDFWTILHLIDPKRFRSFWNYVGEHCIVLEDVFGKQIAYRPQDVERFKQFITQYMLRRLKDTVLPELPARIRQVIPYEMTSKQAEIYDLIGHDILESQPDLLQQHLIELTPNQAVRVLRLRQVLITPQLLGYSVPGALMEMLPEVVQDEFDRGKPAVIFTPFRQAIPFIKQALAKQKCKFYEVHGGISLAECLSTPQRFQTDEDPRRVLIATIKSGASWTAHAASTAIFLGYEWDSHENIQAEDRLHRLGQKDSVHCKYFLCPTTIDESVMANITNKYLWSRVVLHPEQIVRKVWK